MTIYIYVNREDMSSTVRVVGTLQIPAFTLRVGGIGPRSAGLPLSRPFPFGCSAGEHPRRMKISGRLQLQRDFDRKKVRGSKILMAISTQFSPYCGLVRPSAKTPTDQPIVLHPTLDEPAPSAHS
jgi:hypothetical protein